MAYKLLLVMILVSGCSATDILSKVSGASNYLAEENIPYGDHVEQTMDIYRPQQQPSTPDKPICTVVFVYGGSWQDGEKSGYGFVGARLAAAGYVVAIPNYRKYPETVFPGFVEDLALALTHPTLARKNTSDRLAIIGHSAGALNAALVAFDRTYLAAVGMDPSVIDLLISIAGPHDYFLPSNKTKWRNIFGESSEQQLIALSVNHVSSQAPPTLILHGESDGIVTPRSARSLADKLAANNVRHTLRTYPKIGHRAIVAALAPPLNFLAPTSEDILSFLNQNACHPSAEIPK